MTEERPPYGPALPAAARVIDLPFTTRTRCLLIPPGERSPAAGTDGGAAPLRPRPAAAPRPPLIVLLHGQGQSGERQWAWLRDGIPPHFAVASPDGFHVHEVRKPDRPIRLGHAWYMYTGDQAAFAESLAQSEAALWRLVEAAIAELGTDPARTYLCGFSQGAYLAHCAAVRAPSRVAGWIAQAGRLKTEFLGEALPAVAGKPVLLQHGRRDAALPPRAAEDSAAALAVHGAAVSLRLYDAGHEITAPMLDDLRAWLLQREPAP